MESKIEAMEPEAPSEFNRRNNLNFRNLRLLTRALILMNTQRRLKTTNALSFWGMPF